MNISKNSPTYSSQNKEARQAYIARIVTAQLYVYLTLILKIAPTTNITTKDAGRDFRIRAGITLLGGQIECLWAERFPGVILGQEHLTIQMVDQMRGLQLIHNRPLYLREVQSDIEIL